MQRTSRAITAVALAMSFGALACSSDDPGPNAGASVEFTSPDDRAAVAGGVHVAMRATGITIERSGDVHDNAGHFHVIADHACTEPGAAIAKDADHVHFGGGQTEGVIYLDPGDHELCLQVGDGQHIALDVTDTVSVTVGVTTRDQWCSVVKDVDDLFAATDASEDDFAVKQTSYENLGRLIRQLEDGLEQVDADARELVATTLAFGASIVNAIVAADDETAAEEALGDVFAEVSEPLPGGTWILENCGVDVNG